MFKQVRLHDAILKFYQRSQPIAFSNAETLYDDLVLLRDQILMYGDLSEAQTNYLNEFIDKFDNKLAITAKGIINKWLVDGELADIVRIAINDEVVDSRDGESNLNLRLNRDIQETEDKIDLLHEKDDQLTAQLAQGVGVSPMLFGAVGDGVTDDTDAILATFNYAKSIKSGVAFGDRSFVFNPSETVRFPYNVSFGSAKIFRTDKVNENMPILELIHEKEKITLNEELLVTEINKNTQVIPELSGYGNAYIQVFDSGSKIFKRRGVIGDPGLGVPKFDQFRVDDSGNVLDEITVDFTNVTKVIIQPMDDYYTTIGGGEFYSEGFDTTVQYYTNGIVVNKSNVVLDKINHNSKTNSASAPTDGFIVLKDCANIRLRDVGLKPRVHNPSRGTYDISMNKVLNVDLDNVNAPGLSEDYWGVMGGNFIKNLRVSKSNLNRVDGHMGITNLELIDSTLGRHGLSAVGFGKLIIRNLTTYAPWVINLRKDYGAFWEGEIEVDGVRQVRTRDEQMGLINAEFMTDFDYGQSGVGMGKKIIVNDYTVDNKQIATTGNNHIYNLINLRPLDNGGALINEYLVPESITINRAKVMNKADAKSGFVFITDVNMSKVRARKPIADSDVYKFDTNVKVSLSDIDFADFSYTDWRSVLFVVGGGSMMGQSGNDGYGLVLNRPFWGITINDSDKVHINLLGRYVRLKTTNSIVSLISANNNGCRSWLDFDKCIVRLKLSNAGSVGINARFDRLNFSQTEFSYAYIDNDTTLSTNLFQNAYKNVLEFTETGGVITSLVNMTGCYLNPQISLSEYKKDLVRYNFIFGNALPYQRFHPKFN